MKPWKSTDFKRALSRERLKKAECAAINDEKKCVYFVGFYPSEGVTTAEMDALAREFREEFEAVNPEIKARVLKGAAFYDFLFIADDLDDVRAQAARYARPGVRLVIRTKHERDAHHAPADYVLEADSEAKPAPAKGKPSKGKPSQGKPSKGSIENHEEKRAVTKPNAKKTPNAEKARATEKAKRPALLDYWDDETLQVMPGLITRMMKEDAPKFKKAERRVFNRLMLWLGVPTVTMQAPEKVKAELAKAFNMVGPGKFALHARGTKEARCLAFIQASGRGLSGYAYVGEHEKTFAFDGVTAMDPKENMVVYVCRAERTASQALN